MHLLHVIDPSSPGGGACTLHLLAEVCRRLTAHEHRVLVLGHGRHADLARRCGLDPAGHMPLVQNVAWSGRRAFRRIMATRSDLGRADLVHAWSLRAAAVVALATPSRPVVATLAVGPVTGPASSILLPLLEHHPMPLLAASTAVRREFRSLGFDRRHVSVLPPGVSPAELATVRRGPRRERWGVGAEAFVIGLLSEPVDWADAQTAVAIATRLIASGREVRVVMHHTAARRASAERWARLFGRPDVIIVDDAAAEPWRLVPDLDAALLIGGEQNAQDLSGAGSPLALITGGGRRLRPMPGILPLLWAMAGGVPVIAEGSDAVHDIIEEGRSGLIVRQRDLNGACDRLARLYDDRTIAGRLGSAAQRLVEERYHVEMYSRRLESVYGCVADSGDVRVDLEDGEVMIRPGPAAREPSVIT